MRIGNYPYLFEKQTIFIIIYNNASYDKTPIAKADIITPHFGDRKSETRRLA